MSTPGWQPEPGPPPPGGSGPGTPPPTPPPAPPGPPPGFGGSGGYGGYGGSGGYGPPPTPPRSGPSPVLWVLLGVLVIGLVVGGVVLLASGGDDDDNASDRTSDRGSTSDTDGGGGDTTGPTDGGDDGGGSGGGGVSETIEALAVSIYEVTPPSVDEADSICMAEAILNVVGQGAVDDVGGDYADLYGGTSLDEDAAIASGVYNCLSREDIQALREDTDWPGAWVPAN